MEKVSVRRLFSDPARHIGARLELNGWVRTVRDARNFGFLELNDGSFFRNLQVVFEESLPDFQLICHLSPGSSVNVTGILRESPGAKQPFELSAETITVVQKTPEEYPLQKKRHGFEFLRTIAHLRPRTNTFSAVFRMRSHLAHAIHRFFEEREFLWIHTPVITSSDCEGAGEMFRVTTLPPGQNPKLPDGSPDYSSDFFGRETGLTVSGQLNVEPFALAFRNVYTFGPTFRAENSNTARHAAEFWMIEPEMAFADLIDDMNLAEAMIRHLISEALEKLPEEMEFFNEFIDKSLLARLKGILESDFHRITYTEAVKRLRESGRKFEFEPEWGRDLQTEHERWLTEELFHGPVFVTDYPKGIKAFYMRDNDDGKTVAAMDLLVPGVGEIIGGSQREEREERLLSKMRATGLNPENYAWYLETRRFGGTPHAGFGLGFERLIMYLSGMQNIRDVIPYPRTPRHAEY